MKTKKIFTFEEFRNIIHELEREKIDYFIYGGFAIDAIDFTKRMHGDLDIIFYSKDKYNIKILFKKLGYKAYMWGRIYRYKKDNKRIDSLFIEDRGDYYEIIGNLRHDKISKGAFEKKNQIYANGLEFTIMPYEWFLLYRDKHHIEEKRRILNDVIEKIIPLCKPLPFLEQKDIDQPKNMDLIEI